MCERLAACAILAMMTAGSVAAAADIAVPMRNSAATGAYDWTGIYLGGHFGAGFSYRNWTLADGATAEAGDAAMVGGPDRIELPARQMGGRAQKAVCPGAT